MQHPKPQRASRPGAPFLLRAMGLAALLGLMMGLVLGIRHLLQVAG